jgi:hypothetical protein
MGVSHTGGMWRSRFPRSLARTRLAPSQEGAFQLAGWLRPGQAGAILTGAVRPAHIAATFADLAGRGYLRIEQTAAAEPDWLITRVRTAPRLLPGQGLLRYEKTLLRRVFRRSGPLLLSQLSRTSAPAIGTVYAQLSRVLGARLSPADPDTGGPARPDQDDTLAALRAFRRFLQDLQPSAAADPWMAFGDYLPYAIAFQLMPEWGERFAGLRPPGSVASGGYQPAACSTGFLRGFTNAGAAGAFTAAVCAHAQPATTFSHHGGPSYMHGSGLGGHTGGHR